MDIQSISLQQVTELIVAISSIKFLLIGIFILAVIAILKPFIKDFIAIIRDSKQNKDNIKKD